MNYIEVILNTDPAVSFRENLIANLLSIGFDSFMESDETLTAYIPEADFKRSNLEAVLTKTKGNASIISINPLPDQNWNALWESQYEPVIVDNCMVRAPFHEKPEGIDYDLVIQPKMSFGTAHHATTQLMIKLILETDLTGKAVLDMGCGTAVLAILASMKNAGRVVAIDNDPWAFENAVENCDRNHAGNVEVILGDIQVVPSLKFDLVLANINRNVLLNDLPTYNIHLANHGIVLLSGFYQADAPMIIDAARILGWQLEQTRQLDQWMALRFSKE